MIRPIPKITFNEYQGKRFHNYRYVRQLHLKFPCIPLWWRDVSSEQFAKLKDLYETVNKNPDEFLQKVFGYNVEQAFYRQIKDTKRIAYKTKRLYWIIPLKDLRDVVYKYRANVWNKSERCPEEYQPLFNPLLKQLMGTKDDYGFLSNGFTPDYSIFDMGEDRKPPVWVCNICGHTDIKEGWHWRTPAGFASHEFISNCPKCGEAGRDMFDVMFQQKKERKFKPYMKYQDNYILWF